MDKKKYDLQDRLIDFAIIVGETASKLNSNSEARYLGSQLIRSGTSPALNYAEAVVAQSKPDFIHKMSICLKELKETEVNLRIIHARHLCSDNQLIIKCKNESSELVAIFSKSLKTVRGK